MSRFITYILVNLFWIEIFSASNLEDIQFKLPDLTIDYPTKGGFTHLEAFKTHINNEILNEKKESDFSKLKWVSYGYPVLVEQNYESNFLTESGAEHSSVVSNSVDRLSYNLSKLFHFSQEGFHIFVEMLTREQRELFAREAELKYKISIEPRQIVRLIPEVFSCNLGIFDASINEKINFKGFARNLRSYPLRVDFSFSNFIRERIILEKRIEKMIRANGYDGFVFDCEFETVGKKIKTNILKITFEQINDLNLIDELFGDNKETVYLTRKQIANLSNSIYSSLKIQEIYEITEHQFSEKFVSNLIELVADSSLKNVDFETALNSLSKYSIDIKGDIKSDFIRSEASSLFRIEQLGKNNHIIVSKKNNERNNSKSENSQKLGLAVGEKIIPKSLKKSKFKNTLTFNQGQGFDEYIGWHICNGKSNTPDLTGKFVVGLDKNNKDYSNVGNIGGNDFIKLSIKQMPSHTHYDLGHNHYIDLKSKESGHHKHEYRDTYWSEGKWLPNRNGDLYSDNPDAIGSKHNDMDNMGWDKLRFTDTTGAHTHSVEVIKYKNLDNKSEVKLDMSYKKILFYIIHLFRITIAEYPTVN
ncbi:tail collar domain-containing [Brachionus plicatilis]|uniref:Tail collar domain-containing n=1 Tax=Brachionus plicatilis TaxID=10195 RepID=A0A3M7Q8M3_BRAPC|nr:tail collar domain-containing [Brachionus plicatilis]